jgi:muramoyltetrapeptide carboxypeptidase
VVGAHALARGRLTSPAPTPTRLADLNAALADRRWTACGACAGATARCRLLDGIDYSALAGRPRALIGFSDITALHLACAAAACRGW